MAGKSFGEQFGEVFSGKAVMRGTSALAPAARGRAGVPGNQGVRP
jgi:hypothetical protein